MKRTAVGVLTVVATVAAWLPAATPASASVLTCDDYLAGSTVVFDNSHFATCTAGDWIVRSCPPGTEPQQISDVEVDEFRFAAVLCVLPD